MLSLFFTQTHTNTQHTLFLCSSVSSQLASCLHFVKWTPVNVLLIYSHSVVTGTYSSAHINIDMGTYMHPAGCTGSRNRFTFTLHKTQQSQRSPLIRSDVICVSFLAQDKGRLRFQVNSSTLELSPIGSETFYVAYVLCLLTFHWYR